METVGAEPGTVYGKGGKPALKTKIRGYVNAARYAPWVVVIDLDNDADCAPPLRTEWVPESTRYLCFRIAVREVEAWLLADRVNLAAFLGVARSKVPPNPEQLPDPKQAMVNLARQSRRAAIRTDMVPREGSGRNIGPAYPSRLAEFARAYWDPSAAAATSQSLLRAIERLQCLVNAAEQTIRPAVL
jgi:hypothetical protein